MNIFVDCTLRDGGYYNDWDFDVPFINSYLKTMKAISVDYVEIGFRSLKNNSFKGPCFFSTEEFLNTLEVPEGLNLGVMVNASEFVENKSVLNNLFPIRKEDSKISLIRVACHVHEFSEALRSSMYLLGLGYKVAYNIMQIADCSADTIMSMATEASKYPIDALYFADSLGNMTPEKTSEIVSWIQAEYFGPIGIHTHDNMGLGLQNTLMAIQEGVTWVDSTVTGMGRGAGNTQTELLIQELNDREYSMASLMSLISKKFEPLKSQYKWGTNAYYYLAGLNNIHPTFIQEMLNNPSYSEEDILNVINSLIKNGGKSYSHSTLNLARSFGIDSIGTWNPESLLKDKEILIIGTGPSVLKYKDALISYIKKCKPYVIVLNATEPLPSPLVDLHVACHPLRLMAEYKEHANIKEKPLVVPKSTLPLEIKEALSEKQIYDFGVSIKENTFSFTSTECIIPSPLVFAYALAICNAGKASKIYLTGFDGYSLDDPRYKEMQSMLDVYKEGNLELYSLTPTKYSIKTKSVYGM